MKNLFNTLFLLLAFATIGNTQITLTSANAPVARTAHKSREVDSTAAKLLNVGTAGANRTWNFSSLALDPNQPAVLYTYAATTGAPQASQFPSATLISREGLDNSKGVSYYRINASEWTGLGGVDSAGDVNLETSKVFQYPFTFNSSFKDTLTFEDPDFGIISLYSKVNCDAWGNVQTPLGTFNALRVKRVDSSSFPFLGIPIDFVATTYEWWTTQHSAPLLSHSTDVISALGEADTLYFASVLSAQTVANQEVKIENHITKAYPTPASNTVSFDLDLPNAANVSAVILSLNGQGMKMYRFGELSAGKQTMKLDVSNMASGFYNVLLMSEKGKIGTQKITVMH